MFRGAWWGLVGWGRGKGGSFGGWVESLAEGLDFALFWGLGLDLVDRWLAKEEGAAFGSFALDFWDRQLAKGENLLRMKRLLENQNPGAAGAGVITVAAAKLCVNPGACLGFVGLLVGEGEERLLGALP